MQWWKNPVRVESKSWLYPLHGYYFPFPLQLSNIKNSSDKKKINKKKATSLINLTKAKKKQPKINKKKPPPRIHCNIWYFLPLPHLSHWHELNRNISFIVVGYMLNIKKRGFANISSKQSSLKKLFKKYWEPHFYCFFFFVFYFDQKRNGWVIWF